MYLRGIMSTPLCTIPCKVPPSLGLLGIDDGEYEEGQGDSVG